MSQLFGFVNKNFIDFFIKVSEELRDFNYDFLEVSPDLLCHSELHGFSGHFPEETSDCFIITETSGNGEYVADILIFIFANSSLFINFATLKAQRLAYGVMVALQILVLPVQVRILVSQQ